MKLVESRDKYGVVSYWYGDSQLSKEDFDDLNTRLQPPQAPLDVYTTPKVDYVLAYEGVDNLMEKLLTIVDALGLPEQQDGAVKDLINDYVYDLQSALQEHRQ